MATCLRIGCNDYFRYYKLCLSSYQDRMMCFRDRILATEIIYPQYTDICSAMCHTQLTK